MEVDVIGKLLTGCDDDEEVQELRSSLKSLRAEIRNLTNEIGKWKTRATPSITIVDNLLLNAETMMRLDGNSEQHKAKKRTDTIAETEGGNDDGDDVGSCD